MRGQWIGSLEGEYEGSLRLELEDRGEFLVGNAYLFYHQKHGLPAFCFPVTLKKDQPFSTRVETLYVYPDGGFMTIDDRSRAEVKLTERFGELPIPAQLETEFVQNGSEMTINWKEDPEKTGSIKLSRSEITGKSELASRPDISSWKEFRDWAVVQRPRNYIFRGQDAPYKLVSTFHRTWRKDLRTWVNNDVRQLFGHLVETVSYPLQLGNMEHNAAFWSILQHHGYPTPMLDWTFSPFVAAYFAFQNVAIDQQESPRIFMFDQTAWNERHGRLHIIADAAPPQVVVIETMPIGNPRSGPQQALSTVTNVEDIEAFIRRQEQEDQQSYLTVCDLPASDKSQIMAKLELMGITYGSLFPGLDGVCRDMKDRLFAQPVQAPPPAPVKAARRKPGPKPLAKGR